MGSRAKKEEGESEEAEGKWEYVHSRKEGSDRGPEDGGGAKRVCGGREIHSRKPEL